MRCLRLFLLGLASVYPLYWIAQFLLFFVPETLAGFWLGDRVQILDISYLQVAAVVWPQTVFPGHWEALAAALFFTALVLGLRGDRFLTGSFALVVLGQAAMLPFLKGAMTSRFDGGTVLVGGLVAFGLSVFGFYRVLQLVGGHDLFERLALLSVFVVLPQAGLWCVLRATYPSFDTRFLVALLVPLYLAAIVASMLPTDLSRESFAGVPLGEILASSAVACLLIIAISLSGYSSDLLNSLSKDRAAPVNLFR